MGILIDSDLHMIFTCDTCHDPILSLEDGQYIALNNGGKLLVHGPGAGPCFEQWLDTHAGEGAAYHLPLVLMRLAATYQPGWMRYSQWTPGQEA